MNLMHNVKRGFSRGSRENGYTLIELMLVVALLALFSIATLSLVVSSGSTYKSIVEEKDIDSSLRIALSYIDTKVRQNDVENTLRLEKNPIVTGKALVIEEAVKKKHYETWIYWSGGKLREALIETGEPVREDESFEIADIGGFRLQFDPERKLLRADAWNKDQRGAEHKLGTVIAVKSGLTDNSEKTQAGDAARTK